MIQYTIKRILLMFPVFFLISLVVFVLLNLAPGKPGQTGGGAENAQSTKSQAASESILNFKRQFNLDKPILFNTRFSWETDYIRSLLITAHALEGDPSAGEQLAAQEKLEDAAAYLVSHLVVLLEDSNPLVAFQAAHQLTLAATRPMLQDSAGDKAMVVAKNRETDAFNREFRSWQCEEQTPECLQAVQARWKSWYQKYSEDYTYTGSEKLSIFFLDTRFAAYWKNLLKLDFGVSVVDRKPILTKLLSKLKYSISLSLSSIVLAYLLAVPLGVYSAVKPGTASDTTMTVGLFILYSLPTFFTGTVLLRLLSQDDPFQWFPTGGFSDSDTPPATTLGQLADIAWHITLPILTSTSVSLAALSRYARTGVIDVIRADYIRTARAKGLSEPIVIIKHAVRNGMIPILTLLGGLLPVLVSGSVVIEVVFNIPGMGSFLVESINLRDYNAVMAILLASSWLTQIGILLSDLSYALVDPRISLD